MKKEEPNIISDWLEQNRNPEIDKQMDKELEYLSKQEIKLENVFNEEKKENIKKFIDEVKAYYDQMDKEVHQNRSNLNE
jgi:macrodomain Ter protein organizer (MatP/YcbG family)